MTSMSNTNQIKRKNTTYYSRNGCLQCKRSHKKCDENKPNCLQCIKKERQCTYKLNFIVETLNWRKPVSSDKSAIIHSTETITPTSLGTTPMVHPSSSSLMVSNHQYQLEANNKFASKAPSANTKVTESSTNYSTDQVINNEVVEQQAVTSKSKSEPQREMDITNNLQPKIEGNTNSIEFDSMVFFSKTHPRMINLLNFDSNEDMPITNFSETIKPISKLWRESSWETVFPLILTADPINTLYKQLGDNNNRLTHIPLDDPNLLEFIWLVSRSTLFLGHFSAFPIPKLDKMLNVLRSVDVDYPLIHNALRYIVATFLRDAYSNHGLSDLSDVWDSYVRIPSMNLCVTLLDEQLKNSTGFFDCSKLAFVVCLLYSPNSSALYYNWKEHLNGVWKLIKTANASLNDEIIQTTKGMNAYTLYKYVRSWLAHKEIFASIVSDKTGIAGNEGGILDILKFPYRIDNNLLTEKFCWVSGIHIDNISMLEKIMEELSKWKTIGIPLNGVHLIKFKFTNTNNQIKRKLHKFAKPLLKQLKNSLDNEDTHNSLSEIHDFKLRFSFKYSNILLALSIELYLRVFFLNEDETNPKIITRLLESIIEKWYCIPYNENSIWSNHIPIYIAAVVSIIIKNETIESQLFVIINNISKTGSEMAGITAKKLRYTKEILLLQKYELLVNPKYDFNLY